MPLQTFAATVRLSLEDLRRLLVEGEPIERVWSAWSLGLKLGVSGGHELAAAAGQEPEAGVRRHMVVVLASAGEVGSLKAMAMHDPEIRVRATAIQYLTRLAAPEDMAGNAFLLRVVEEGPPILQQACIEALSWKSASDLWAAVERRIVSQDPDVRRAAYEATMMAKLSSEPATVGLAAQFLTHEPDEAARRRSVELLLSIGGRTAATSLLGGETLSADLLEEILVVLAERDQLLPWESLEALFSRIPRTGHCRVIRALEESTVGPLRPRLLAMFVKGRVEPTEGDWELGSEVVAKLNRALEQNRDPLSIDEKELRRGLEAYVARLTAEAQADPDAFDLFGDATEDAWFLSNERLILTRLAGLSEF